MYRIPFLALLSQMYQRFRSSLDIGLSSSHLLSEASTINLSKTALSSHKVMTFKGFAHYSDLLLLSTFTIFILCFYLCLCYLLLSPSHTTTSLSKHKPTHKHMLLKFSFLFISEDRVWYMTISIWVEWCVSPRQWGQRS